MISGGLRRAVVVSACASALAAHETTARAAEPVKVHVEGCGETDLDEIERLVALDLASVLEERGGAAFPPVRVECDGPRMRIVVRDPVTAKTLERDLPAPKPGEVGRERTIALAISQLFLTSWTELLLPPAPVGPPPQPKGAVAAKRVARRTIAKELPGADWDLLGVGTATMRDLGAPFVTFGAALRPSVGLGREVRAFAQVGGEAGASARTRGLVDASLVSIGAGLGWRSSPSRSSRAGFAFEVLAGAGVTLVRLEGRPASDAVTATSASGVVADASVAAGPTWRVGVLRVGLEGRLGFVAPSAIGAVSGERAVRIGGPWIGAGFSLGLAFGGEP